MQLFKHQRYDAANGAAFYEISAKLASKQSWLRCFVCFAAGQVPGKKIYRVRLMRDYTNTHTHTNIYAYTYKYEYSVDENIHRRIDEKGTMDKSG